jgi:hypothetical protein
VTTDVLDARALGRATLARQLLLAREPRDLCATVEHLVGLQAQVPHNPYTALWSRLEGFEPEALSRLIEDRHLVRIVTLRGTVHLVTADDALLLRPLAQPVLEAEMARHRDHRDKFPGVDLDAVMAVLRPLVEDRPRTGTELRALVAEHLPDLDAPAMAFAVRNKLAMVQVPPRGLWGRGGQVRTTTAEAWLGRPVVAEPDVDAVVLRYLAAFGPAAVADVATWSRLTGLREVVDRLRPRLRPFRDERGRELFDLPDAPRPDPGTPAPVRFLPEYDNVLLSHDDRSRFIRPEHKAGAADAFAGSAGSVLHDGTVGGAWRLDRDKASGTATLTVRPLGTLGDAAEEAVTAEGARLLVFLAAGAAAHHIRVVR